jgi:hypothetical protein
MNLEPAKGRARCYAGAASRMPWTGGHWLLTTDSGLPTPAQAEACATAA